MQFIEQLFGFSPDGGTGLTELSILAVALTAILITLKWRSARKGSYRV